MKLDLKKSRGFTLVEMLVVMLVMGISLGIVAVQWMPDDRALLRTEAERLALLLENAGLEARASGRALAWSTQPSGYVFWKKNRYQDWVRIEDDSAFRPRSLPAGMQINQVWVEELPLKAGEQLALSASSFALPFRIQLSKAAVNLEVLGKSTGEVILASPL